ncbi:hypothetical protein SCUCBS95973_009033 [Sporothrix curviconia]|uniref:Uncharacterized protein n=1 Tax=Sporothrix curviconia TaxID=1260050 RepID=A0ABP0CRK1_9PEZI
MLMKLRTVNAATPANNAKSTCTSSSCFGVTLGIIIGSAVIICMAACVAFWCNRGRRKVKNTVKSKVLGMIFRSSANKGGNQPAADEERLRPQQPPPPAGLQPQAPIYYQQPAYYEPNGQPYSNPADAPYEFPRYPEYPSFQGQPKHPPQNQPWQPRQPQPSKREAKREAKQQTRTISPEETPVERQMRLNRLATTLASSM